MALELMQIVVVELEHEIARCWNVSEAAVSTLGW
jgi:hypothetical protein